MDYFSRFLANTFMIGIFSGIGGAYMGVSSAVGAPAALGLISMVGGGFMGLLAAVPLALALEVVLEIKEGFDYMREQRQKGKRLDKISSALDNLGQLLETPASLPKPATEYVSILNEFQRAFEGYRDEEKYRTDFTPKLSHIREQLDTLQTKLAKVAVMAKP